MTGPEVGVSLKEKLLHRGDSILKFVGYRRIIDRALGVTNLLFVGKLLFFQFFDIRRIDRVAGLEDDGLLEKSRRLGKFKVLGQFLGLACFGGGQADLRALVGISRGTSGAE